MRGTDTDVPQVVSPPEIKNRRDQLNGRNSFQEERIKWRAADIELFFLPSYSPELSGIESLWRDVKQHRMRRLSQNSLLDLKHDVDEVLADKARHLLASAKC